MTAYATVITTLSVLVASCLNMACSIRSVEQLVPQEVATAEPDRFGYEVVRTYPHDPLAFTQGLVYGDGVLFESTGLNGSSSLRRVRLDTGEVLQQQDLPREYFGEGLALWDGSLLQLTWRSGMGFVYDAQSFERVGGFAYAGEGWGLTHDGVQLVLSDGTAWLRFVDPDTLVEIGRVAVTDRGQPVTQLNELEFVDGRVYANVWLTDRIAIIDPESGRVEGWIDLTGLLPATATGRADVLNGIAYDAASDRLFVTGKLWPSLFEVRLIPE
jgi:glutamine cyclotransferase